MTESEEDEARELHPRHENEVQFFPVPVVTRTLDPNTHLWNQRSVNTVEDDMLEVVVNGHHTFAFLDTGCTSCVISFEKASEMGLLQYEVGMTQKTFFLWSDVQTFDLIVVKNVPVEIRGGPRFLLTALVFLPGEMPSHVHEFSLDNWTLRRLEVE